MARALLLAGDILVEGLTLGFYHYVLPKVLTDFRTPHSRFSSSLLLWEAFSLAFAVYLWGFAFIQP